MRVFFTALHLGKFTKSINNANAKMQTEKFIHLHNKTLNCTLFSHAS